MSQGVKGSERNELTPTSIRTRSTQLPMSKAILYAVRIVLSKMSIEEAVEKQHLTL